MQEKVFALFAKKLKFCSDLFLDSYMLILIYIIVIFLFFVFYFRDFYIGELTISFLPYIIFLLLICLIFAFLRFRKIHYWYKKLLFGVSVLFLGFLFLVYSKEFNWFYDWAWYQNFTWSDSLDILYANIHRQNNNYQELKDNIEKYDPDLIMFVEFSEEHYDNLKEFLQKKYPYINSTSWSKKFIWSMVFSKYPINNWADDFEQWTWRYAYFQVSFDNNDYYVYLVHTSSPDSYSHFLLRNQQLNIFLNDFQKHNYFHNGSQDNVLIIWDFNVSPWSSYYKKFQKWLWSGFKDLSNKLEFVYTWKWKYLPFLASHIDHFWVNFELTGFYMEKCYLKWSDHYWFFWRIPY